MWKKLLGWLIKFAPGIAEAIISAKAKDAAQKPKPKDTSGV